MKKSGRTVNACPAYPENAVSRVTGGIDHQAPGHDIAREHLEDFVLHAEQFAEYAEGT